MFDLEDQKSLTTWTCMDIYIVVAYHVNTNVIKKNKDNNNNKKN